MRVELRQDAGSNLLLGPRASLPHCRHSPTWKIPTQAICWDRGRPARNEREARKPEAATESLRKGLRLRRCGRDARGPSEELEPFPKLEQFRSFIFGDARHKAKHALLSAVLHRPDEKSSLI